MDKVYNHKEIEPKWYKFWEESGFFKPEINPDGKPFTIILPPPNANADLHFGHAMYVIEDILIRYHRMKGDAALWLPGADHAGFETQVVFEKKLAAEGKSRFDFDRETLYQLILEFVQENKDKMLGQLRRLGFSLDWSRFRFTLDPEVVKVVYQTFKKLYDDGFIYRAERLVNFCTKDGTSFSDLEIVYVEKTDQLYFIRYPFVDGSDSIVVATTRPETMFGDMAVAVNPADERYKDFVGKKVKIPLTERLIPIIADEAVQTDFGTGAVKVTPAHDPLDWEIGKRHNLPILQVVSFSGEMTEEAGKYAGSKVVDAKSAVVSDLEAQGFIEKVEEAKHRVGTCYKCSTVIEPLPKQQWFVDVKPLSQRATRVVSENKVKIWPESYKKNYLDWLANIKDWNISRQIVWGIRIPAWQCQDCDSWTVTKGEKAQKCEKCNSARIEQDPDTFDTWFSSGQWPFATLKTTQKGDFGRFYPTQVMETGYDILFFWVARMVMLGLYATDKIPFQNIILHGLVRDPLGKKMSKSKGNVVSPIDIIDQYGADAARLALVYGTALGHDQALSHPKLTSMRNFTNKLWNIGRFIVDFKPGDSATKITGHEADQAIIKKLNTTIGRVTLSLDNFDFNQAASDIYQFVWHEFADNYIEQIKTRRGDAQPCLEYVFEVVLRLLHPFMPYVTEELWQVLPHHGESVMTTTWPDGKN